MRGGGPPRRVSFSRLTTPIARRNNMTDVVFVSRYQKRVQFVQDVLQKNSKLGDKDAHRLAVEVVHAIDHIPEERRQPAK
jgi:ATP-dependent Clp protease adapter protein ClpS